MPNHREVVTEREFIVTRVLDGPAPQRRIRVNGVGGTKAGVSTRHVGTIPAVNVRVALSLQPDHSSPTGGYVMVLSRWFPAGSAADLARLQQLIAQTRRKRVEPRRPPPPRPGLSLGNPGELPDEPTTSREPLPQRNDQRPDQHQRAEPARFPGAQAEPTTPPAPEQESQPRASSSAGLSTWSWLAVGVLALGAVVAGLVYRTRKRKVFSAPS